MASLTHAIAMVAKPRGPVRFLGLLTILLSVSYLSLSQSPKVGKSIVHYKDGSVFIGQVVSSNHPIIRFRSTTGDTLSLWWDQIKKIQDPAKITLHNKGKYHFTEGFFGSFSIGLSPGVDYTTEAEILIGKRLNNKFAIGLGSSLATSSAEIGGIFLQHDFFTVHGYGRYYLNNRKVRLYADLRVGYGFSRETFWVQDHSGGIYAQPGFGILLPSRSNFKWYISINQYLQYTSGTETEFGPFQNPFTLDYNILHNRTVIKVGIEFK